MNSASNSKAASAGADAPASPLSQALDGLRLSQPHLPEASEPDRTFWVADDNLNETAFKVVSPAQTGKTAAALLRLFQTDMKQDWPVPFSHPVFDANEDVALFSRLPMYFHRMRLEEKLFEGDGIVRNPQSTDYFLLLANEQGRFTSFAKFKIGLGDWFWGGFTPGEDEQQGVELTIELDALYTRCRFRGRGACTALAEAVAYLADQEIQNLAAQLAPFHAKTGTPVRVVPNLISCWKSKTGLLAHEKVVDALNEMAQGHADLQDLEPIRRSVDFAFCDDDMSDYD